MTLPRAVPEPDVRIASLAGDERNHDQRDEHKSATTEEAVCHREHLPSSETEILERFGSAAVQHRGAPFLSTLGGQVALRDPRRGTMRTGRQLGERVVGITERDLCFV